MHPGPGYVLPAPMDHKGSRRTSDPTTSPFKAAIKPKPPTRLWLILVDFQYFIATPRRVLATCLRSNSIGEVATSSFWPIAIRLYRPSPLKKFPGS